MAAPEVHGHQFADHIHVEYPKVVYGDQGATRTVGSAEEEEAAAEDGFLPVGVPDATEAEAEALADPAPAPRRRR